MATRARLRSAAGTTPTAGFSSVTAVGWIVDVDGEGHARVDFPGNCAGPLPARSLVRWTKPPSVLAGLPTAVLLGFEGIDTSGPIILGTLHATVLAPADPPPGLQATVRLDGRCLELSAEREIVLQCGRASITLRADGQLVIKGSELTSRASGTHRIKGASVSIN